MAENTSAPDINATDQHRRVVEYTIGRATIDGLDFPDGAEVRVSLIATVRAGLPGSPRRLVIQDWGGPCWAAPAAVAP